MPGQVPVILLSPLAVDRKEQGSGLGRNLLRDAVLRSVGASEIIGVRLEADKCAHDDSHSLCVPSTRHGHP